MKKITREEFRCLKDWSATKDLSNLDFSGLDLSNLLAVQCNFSGSNFTNVNLCNTEFFGCDLTNTNFSGANLDNFNFGSCVVDNIEGLPSQESILDKFFENTKNGYIVYKIFGLYYVSPLHWRIEEGSIIEEKVYFHRGIDNSYGINVTTKDIAIELSNRYGRQVWKCLIAFEDLDKVCVPIKTKGNIRCGRLKLLEIVK